MKTLRYKSYDPAVYLLEQILVKLGFPVVISNYFGKDTETAVKSFQLKHDLVIDGIVGVKTWSKLLAIENTLFNNTDKLLSEKDLMDFSKKFNLDLAIVKAINEVESNGKGFLISGRAKILFEGHVFWKELEKRGISPEKYVSAKTRHVLYPKWTKKYYVGGEGEYLRLETAASIQKSKDFHDAAHASASWGAFQIMGYHYKDLGYTSVNAFVEAMQIHEREHLHAFGMYLKANKLLPFLREKDWDAFSRAYNGPSYKKNQYDKRLKLLYFKYTAKN
ncbi:N-acetylmuramidase family protein [Galbibacter pacificus]|uniref:N-acetylmuramidase family protein n=1 Tax=Galbibacter pacificus TaxID=2996052 RepID=A0ABT6FQX4_9FLAO|nr:N-acetylmuramidase family protein [Galbibacter pacificus]MDG3582067.1 N-acetylmuramidase family protein [Galbibacter pacificus]MDG3585459.1 N-acetylmuramidase family protein [Galbibacter pacificus]